MVLNAVLLAILSVLVFYIWDVLAPKPHLNPHPKKGSKENHRKLKKVLKQVHSIHPDLKLYYLYLLTKYKHTVCTSPEEFIELFEPGSSLLIIDPVETKDLILQIENASHYGYINEIFHEMLDSVQIHPILFGEEFQMCFSTWQTNQLEERCKMLYSPVQHLNVLQDGTINKNSNVFN